VIFQSLGSAPSPASRCVFRFSVSLTFGRERAQKAPTPRQPFFAGETVFSGGAGESAGAALILGEKTVRWFWIDCFSLPNVNAMAGIKPHFASAGIPEKLAISWSFHPAGGLGRKQRRAQGREKQIRTAQFFSGLQDVFSSRSSVCC